MLSKPFIDYDIDLSKVRMRPLGSSYNSIDKLAIHARTGLKTAVWVVVIHIYGCRV